MKKFLICCFCLIVADAILGTVIAHAVNDPDAISYRIGYGSGNLNPPQGEYDFTHFGISYNYRLDQWVEDHWHMDTPGEWWGSYVAYLGIINEPESNIELSAGLGLQFSFPLDDHWKPHIYGGTGPIYSSQNTEEQSTDLNIGSYAGFGLEYMIDERQSVSLIKAIRHFSNASVRDPNDGVDISAWAIGYTVYLD